MVNPYLPWALDVCLVVVAALAAALGAGLVAFAALRIAAADDMSIRAVTGLVLGLPGLLLIVAAVSVLPRRPRAWRFAATSSRWAAAMSFVWVMGCAAACGFALRHKNENGGGLFLLLGLLLGVPAAAGFIIAACQHVLVCLPRVRRAYQSDLPPHWVRRMLGGFCLRVVAVAVTAAGALFLLATF